MRTRRARGGTGWRWLLVIALLAGVLLAACQQEDEKAEQQAENNRMSDWEQSLRAELDWLWERVNYLATTGRPDDALCAPRTFEHRPVTLSEEERAENDLSAKLEDQLSYAQALLADAHGQWERFCDLQATGVDVRAYMLARLDPAANALNIAREALDMRDRSLNR